MIREKVKIEEVDNLSILESVDEVSNGTTQNER
jgi:hypothetical protein